VGEQGADKRDSTATGERQLGQGELVEAVSSENTRV
jgi:hypothetical protein